MALPANFLRQTTRARSIMTLDGYVSRGKAPPDSLSQDHDMLQDFAAYLELRLKSQNLSMLRRIFADFLNEHENTLVPMMKQGCTMITIFPMLRTSAKRRHQAEILLAKPKSHLDNRVCVFLYLQYRVATRNMALLKHLFLEFLYHQETTLLAFVKRGCEVISVIPFELPQMRPPRMESPRAEEAVMEQEQVTKRIVPKTKNKRKRRAPVKDAMQKLPSTASASVDVTASQSVVTEPRRRLRKAAKTRGNAASEAVNKRRRNHAVVVSTSGLACSKVNVGKSAYPASSPLAMAVTTPKRGKMTKASIVSPLVEAAEVAMEQARAAVWPEQTGVANALKHTVAGLSQQPSKRKQGRKRKPASQTQKSADEKSLKRGKPTMSEEKLSSQLKLALKMEIFVAQSPWEVVFDNLPAPFEEDNHPEVLRKFRKFWRKHSHAVWERNFWVPISRRLNGSVFNKRNNRQLAAKNAFESLIIAVYEEFGAEFFVKLDTQKPRHPGWWYRGPIVALFTLQQIKGENAMWEYVKNDILERFPDCKLPLPLAASINCDATRSRHKRESESMWMDNRPLTAEILREITALKGEQQPSEQEVTMDPDQELQNR